MKPNIVMIYMDDMGWRDIGCNGSSFYETPVIDRLAREGMRFTNAYAACPVCSPSRASLLTGKYPARTGITDWIGAHAQGLLEDTPYDDHLKESEYTLAHALRDGGYHTWHVGKWHLGEQPHWPEAYGFEENIGGCSWGRPMQGYFAPWGIATLSEGAPGDYLTDRLTDEAIALVQACDDRPFYLNLWHYAVHTPCDAPENLIEKYRRKAQALGLDKINPFVEGETFPCEHKKTERVTRRMIQSDPNYAAMVENLDLNIGRLLEGLEKAGKLKNTLILFTSDNGGLATAEGSPTCNAPLIRGQGVDV
ncbi:MAG: sulfatase-like hydrolase/transferase [Eubacteriales bacterium]|nr:sulfatase-like hydrolase/transferase [Eubacteriales bacterium]